MPPREHAKKGVTKQNCLLTKETKGRSNQTRHPQLQTETSNSSAPKTQLNALDSLGQNSLRPLGIRMKPRSLLNDQAKK